MADRDKHIYMAKLAEQAEKYDGESLYGLDVCLVASWNLPYVWVLSTQQVAHHVVSSFEPSQL